MELIEPSLGLKLIMVGGWLLAALGAVKVAVYLVGEFAPRAYDRFFSEKVRRWFTGKGNRLIFGLGGFLTLLLGLLFVGAAHLLAWVNERFGA